MIKTDIKLFVVLFSLFQISRICLFLGYSEQELVGESVFNFLSLPFFIQSIRFDIMVSAYLMIPSLLLSFLFVVSHKNFVLELKRYYCIFAVLFSLLICIVNFFFFAEYHCQFNHFILGIFTDDAGAIINVAWQNYPLFKMCVGIVIASIALWFLFKRVSPNLPKHLFISGIAICILLVAGMRGGTLWGSVVNEHQNGITASAFVNNTIANPLYLLKEELIKTIGNNSMESLKELYAVDENRLYEYMDTIFGKRSDDLDELLSQKKASQKKEKFSHIFIVICESFSSWGLKEEYSNGRILEPNTKKYAEEFPSFPNSLPSGMATFDSVSSIMLGFPFMYGMGHKLSHTTTRDFMPAVFMKEAGYDCNFFYAGPSTWNGLRYLVNFCQFNVIGGENMGFSKLANQWGSPDADLFKYVLNYEYKRKSCNIILTVSNHEPFDINLSENGCPYLPENRLDEKILHHWYGDKELGIFVENILKKYEDALVVVTGDHPARIRYSNAPNELKHIATIPIVFVSNKKLEIKSGVCATHLDIFATIFDMMCDSNAVYKTWGNSLCADNNQRIKQNNEVAFFEGKYFDLSLPTTPEFLRKKKHAYYALAAWRISRNNGIIESAQKNSEIEK